MSGSEGPVEEDNPTLPITSALYTGMDLNKSILSCDSEDLRQGDDHAAHLLADSSSVVQAHAISDPIFAPVRKTPLQILAKIFIECIPSLELKSPPPSFENGTHQHQVRARIGQVCRMWNAVLNDEPGVWATLVLDGQLPVLEIVSLWINRSKSHPLDVSIKIEGCNGYMDMDASVAVVKMLHRELWRIRSFFAEDFLDFHASLPLFPPCLLTTAPMMQSLTLKCYNTCPKTLGWIHCPQLRTLTLQNCDEAIESLISKPMQNLRVLTIINDFNDMVTIKLLQALPDLVSLTWHTYGERLPYEIPRVVLRSLKSLTFDMCCLFIVTLYVPSLEYLELFVKAPGTSTNMVLDSICGDGAVQLRHLTLRYGCLRSYFHATLWHYLKHLETLAINDVHGNADELLIPLSPLNRDFSSVCPQLKTLELLNVKFSTGALVDFVQRRVKSDLGGPGPGLVTCLKLSNMLVDKEVFAQLAKTHSLSVHLLGC